MTKMNKYFYDASGHDINGYDGNGLNAGGLNSYGTRVWILDDKYL
jgi:hypothetical protein